MTAFRKMPWARFSFESAIVIVSILAAFGIDAWWNDRKEEIEGRELARALHSDVMRNQEYVEQQIEYHTKLLSVNQRLLASISTNADTLTADLREIGNIFVMGKWYPSTDTYQQALSTGQLLLVNSIDLRLEIAEYNAKLDYLKQFNDDISLQYRLMFEPFMVSNVIYSEVANSKWLENPITAPYSTDFAALAESSELWNLLTLRLEQDVAILRYLEAALEAGAHLSASLIEYSDV